jgi:hypothetical protein
MLAHGHIQGGINMPSIAALKARIAALGQDYDTHIKALENDDITLAEFQRWEATAEPERKALRAQRDAAEFERQWRGRTACRRAAPHQCW